MRLIDADELLIAMDTWDKFGYDEQDRLIPIYHDDERYVPYVHYEDMVKAVNGMPTIDARVEAIDECFNKIEQRLNDDTEISVNIPIEEVLGDDVDVNGFLMLAEAIVQKYKGLIFNKLKEAKHQLKEQNIK